METLLIIGQIVLAILIAIEYRNRERQKWIERDNNPYNTCKRNEEYRIKLVPKEGEKDG